MIELLTVIAITMLLAVLITVGLGTQKGAALRSAAFLVGGLADQARQLAVSSRRETALALAKSGPGAYRAMAVLQADSSGNWRQVGRWTQLPENIVFDFSDAASTFFASATSNATNALSYPGANLAPGAGYCAQGFRRDGLLYGQTEPVALRLREGFLAPNGSSITYTANTTNRYYDVVLIPTGARAKYATP